MLEIRNLTKIYRSKTGEEVRALDDVSISFPESGMVFILGKSGSGKSTLLNIMGGLDSYDSGEFIIKGKSSKDFAGSDFDAYRNTFIGFIFQEYNVLDDFTVGANIALALELQGKKASAETVNAILSSVDLLNFAKRKPNELSGGQKQRVAIARALVKEPQIIMADEPTGALDSNTGKQIFDTLKELSREKLVLIVSHDRDFAERYADRIIELADGQIISDVTKHEHESEKISEGIDRISGHILKIKSGYRLTAEDLEMINRYLAEHSEDVLLSGDGRVNDELRSAAGISDRGTTAVFEGTDAEKDYTLKKYEKQDSKFIRSRLPMKNAIRMGSSGLKHKKFRLVMTVFLSLIAFALFGFADTLGAYEKVGAAVTSIQDSNVKTAALSLGVRREVWRDGKMDYVSFDQQLLNDNDIALLKEKTGIDFIPVYGGSSIWDGGFTLNSHFQNYTQNSVYTGRLTGMVSITPETAAQAGLTVTGRLPEGEGEIAITELAYRQFNKYGFQNSVAKESVSAGNLVIDPSGGANSIIGKHITLQGRGVMNTMTYKIVGVVDTGFDYTRYEPLLPGDRNEEPADADLATMVLQNEVESELFYGFHMLAFMGKTDLESFAAATFTQEIGEALNSVMNKGIYFSAIPGEGTNSNANENRELYAQKGDIAIDVGNGVHENGGTNYHRVAGSEALSLVDVTWLDGTPRTTLGANEIVLPKSFVEKFFPTSVTVTVNDADIGAEVDRLYGSGAWAQTDLQSSYGHRWVAAAKKAYVAEQRSKLEVNDAIMRAIFREQYPELDPELEYDSTLITPEQIDRQWDFWMNGDDTFLCSLGSVSIKRAYEVENEARRAGVAYLTGLIGLEKLPTYFTENKDALEYALSRGNMVHERKLDEMTASDPELSLSDSDYASLMKAVMAYRYVTEQNALENETFINEVILSEDSSYKNEWNTAVDSDRENKISIAIRALTNYLGREDGGYRENQFGAYTGKQIDADVQNTMLQLNGTDINALFDQVTFSLQEEDYETQFTRSVHDYDFKVVGYFSHDGDSSFIISDTVLADYNAWQESVWNTEMDYREVYAEHEEGKWSFVLAPMPTDPATIRTLVELGYDENVDLQFNLQNAVMNTLDTFNEFIEIGAMIFLYVGIGFAVFSALLLMNFIATSISYKKREIGVLRAVGARSSDVFKIFFSEALIIALVNFLLSTAAVVAAIIFTNTWMHNSGINVTLLSYGPRQFILMLLISVGVALLASFLPVYNIAKRKPVDAIKNR